MTTADRSSRFFDLLDSDLTWRLDEINQLRRALSNDGILPAETIARAAIVLLYAHWEGYVKTISTAFLGFVAEQVETFAELRREFCAIGAEQVFAQLRSGEKRIREKVDILDRLHRLDYETASTLKKYQPSTKSNLRYEVFSELCDMICVDADQFETDKNFINKIICDRKNYVAHGNELSVDHEEFEEVSEHLLDIMRRFKDSVYDSAIHQRFLRMYRA